MNKSRFRWIAAVIRIVMMIGILTVRLFASPAAQPKITWSSTSVEVILSPGETSTKDFTFTSDQALQNAVFEPGAADRAIPGYSAK